MFQAARYKQLKSTFPHFTNQIFKLVTLRNLMPKLITICFILITPNSIPGGAFGGKETRSIVAALPAAVAAHK